MRLFSWMILLGILAGCATSPRKDENLLPTLHLGMSQQEAQGILSNSKLLFSAWRPRFGWPSVKDGNFGTERAAFRFEHGHPGAMVVRCDVYNVPEDPAKPLPIGGPWFDFLFFDRDNRLIGYVRKSSE